MPRPPPRPTRFPYTTLFRSPVQVTEGKTGEQKATIKVRSQACKEGTCLPPADAKLTLFFTVAEGPAREDRTKPILTAPKDRKSTRLNSSHGYISYAVFCLKK